ncbi:hypothetical protein BJV77DRAFT_411153 [Russula vinacea]|nr:hypothetical protein BJV77DRAFT_411153 [Russula vinacea]
MMLHETFCAKCHNEDGKYYYNSANHADPGKITPELHDIIDGITQIEEMLRSRASPCFVMRVIKNDQCLHLPNTWTLDTLAYVDNTDSGSRDLFSQAPGFRTTKTSRHSDKHGMVERSNIEDKWSLPWVPLMCCVVNLPPSIFLCRHSFVSFGLLYLIA